MDPERWPRVRAVVEAAFGVPEGQRSALLDEACGEDAELRAEVEALLHQDGRDTSSLDPPDRESLWSCLTGASVASGADLGDFVIEDELGAGGMGVVYAARQKNPERRVALKMLRSGAASAETLRRFRHEAEVLGRLKHPGIAQIHSAGIHEEQGREVPWFAMELVENARTLTDYAREEKLSLDRRLELFLEVADAVHLGHQKGVIHRDLKPGNVLVGADGHPKVIDFGVARSLGVASGRLTEERTTAGVIGTLQSMSPEQAAGDPDLDVRSDVYSLGVLLYELLTGTTPHDFEGKPVHEALRMVAQDPPRRPRSVAPGLPEDLEIVLLRALEKEKHRRYASARELAADLERFREHQPIEARRPGTAYQLRLFARRHRGLVSASVVSALALGVALVWSLASAREARAAERVATEQRDEADRLRLQESEARALAEDLFRRSLEVNVRLVRDLAARIKQLPGSTRVASDLLDLSTRHLEFMAEAAGTLGPAHDALAHALVELGDVQGAYHVPSLAEEELAGRSYERALGIARELHGSAPDAPAYLELLAQCEGNLGLWRLMRGEHDLARELLELQVDHLARAIDLVANPLDLERRLANALQHVATLDGLQGDFDASLERAGRAREIYARLLTTTPDDPGVATQLAVATGKCGMARMRLGDTGGMDDLEEECALLRATIDRAPHHAPAQWLLAETRLVMCQLSVEQGELDAARANGGEALAILELLLEHEATSAKYRRLVSHVHFNLGSAEELAAERADDPERARDHWREAAGWFARALELNEQLAREGALPPQEQDHPRRIRERLERARSAL